VIFTTAYEKFALQGYELNVLDYLLKPIAYERFLKACCKAQDLLRIKENRETTYLFIKTEHKLEKLFFGEILFAEAMENYVAIYSGDKKIITHSTLKSVQESLPPKQFVQTHKSYIVNMDQISAIEGNVLHVGPYQVPVSKYLKEAVFEKILNNKLLKK
jgi:DNA-binding LytR/AlgR family response regulator